MIKAISLACIVFSLLFLLMSLYYAVKSKHSHVFHNRVLICIIIVMLIIGFVLNTNL